MANHIGSKRESIGEGRQAVLYGAPFVGKTTTLDDPNIKVHMCDFDHNTSPLDKADNVTIFSADSFEDYLEFKASVQRGYYIVDNVKILIDVDLVAFDSFTRFEELIKDYVARVYAPKRAREITGKFGAQTDWDDLQRIEVQEVRDWQAMTRTKGFCSVWMGHDMAVPNNVTKQTERIQLALQGKYASPRITSAVDAIMYMQKVEKDGVIYRGVHTQQYGAAQADVRLPVADRLKLPPYVKELVWSKFLPFLGWVKPTK